MLRLPTVRLGSAIFSVLPLIFPASVALGTSQDAEAPWKTYVLGGTLRFEYPASWFPIRQDNDTLSILSGRERAEAVIVVPGEALIVVAILPDTKADQLDAFAQTATNSGDRVISNKDLVPSTAHGCSRIHRTVTVHEWAPQSHEMTTTFLCAIPDRVIMCAESHFQGDDHQMEYEDVALRITRSIQLVPNAVN